MPWLWDLNCDAVFPDSVDCCEPPKPKLIHVAHRVMAMKEQSFSEQIAARIEAPQISKAIYKAKWAIYVRLCTANKIDLNSEPFKQIRKFCLHAFQEQDLKPSTIDDCRSAN